MRLYDRPWQGARARDQGRSAVGLQDLRGDLLRQAAHVQPGCAYSLGLWWSQQAGCVCQGSGFGGAGRLQPTRQWVAGATE